jgi:hypothetical protein
LRFRWLTSEANGDALQLLLHTRAEANVGETQENDGLHCTVDAELDRMRAGEKNLAGTCRDGTRSTTDGELAPA